MTGRREKKKASHGLNETEEAEDQREDKREDKEDEEREGKRIEGREMGAFCTEYK